MARRMGKWLIIVAIVFCFQSVYGEEVVYQLDFTGQPDGDAISWFKNNGFDLRIDADELTARFDNGRLVIENPDHVGGIFTKEVQIDKASHIRIEWGVEQYPQGADWEEGRLREAIGVIVSFGTEKISSGSFFVPNLPYFIGFFLGEHAIEGKAYTGNYYKKGGRYFCVPCRNPAGQRVVTDFPLHQTFRQQFSKSPIPPITSVSIESDTRDTSGISKGFINRITFYIP